MRQQDLDRRAAELNIKMAEGLGTRGKTFEATIARAGRAIPKAVRRDFDVIVQARAIERHPKLSRQIDQAKVDAAIRKTAQWLDTLDRPARRRAAALDMLADIGFKVVIVAGLVLMVLVWRGFL